MMDEKIPASEHFKEFLGEFTRKVVVIDDDPDMVILIKAIVEKLQGREQALLFECLEAADGPTGLDVIRQERPDLVILDVQMPGMSGVDVLEEIRRFDDAHLAKLPVLMLTAKNDPTTVIQAKRRGATGYLLKPFVEADLVDRIQTLLRV